MCGIPVLSLKRVNKPTTKDNRLAHRHRSDGGREGRGGGERQRERGVHEMRQTVLAAKGHGSYKGSEPEFGDTRQKHCGPCFG